MASSSMTSSRSSGSSWTPRENKLFEEALAYFNKDSPDGWHNIARAVGGKSVEEVKRQYDILVRDIREIETDQVPLPNYRDIGSNGRGFANERRLFEESKATMRLWEAIMTITTFMGGRAKMVIGRKRWFMCVLCELLSFCS